MLRVLLELLLGRSKSEQPAQSSEAGETSSSGKPAPPDRDRLPPRDDSFYLGICFSHW